MIKSDFFRLPAATQATAWLLGGFALFVAWEQSHWWGSIPDYSFGFLVPLFVGYVIHDRWPAIKAALIPGAGDPGAPEFGMPLPETPGWLGRWTGRAGLVEAIAAAVLLGALLAVLAGSVLRAAQGPTELSSFLLAGGLAGCVLAGVYLGTERDAGGGLVAPERRVALAFFFLFPALVWLISAPLLPVLQKKLSLFLLNKVTVVVFTLFEVSGFNLIREGNVLKLPQGEVGVAEACSGIRSLTACLFAGSFLGAVFLERFWKKVVLVASAMVFAFLTNILRSLFLTGWAYRYGSGSLDEKYLGVSVHDITGYAVLGLTCLGLVCLLPLVNLQLEYDDPDAEPAEGGSAGAGPVAETK